MELRGRRVAVLGDSITEGVGVADPKSCYWSLLGEKYGWNLTVDGISGTRFARQTAASEDPRFDLDFCTRAAELPREAEIVTVFGGTNDFGHSDAPFGRWGDKTQDTFCGACDLLMRTLIARCPRAVIVIMTPLHRLNEENPCGDIKPAPVAVLEEYVDMIIRTARRYALPVLDLYAVSGLQPNLPVIQEMYVPDGLHPNEAGQEILAARLEGFLKSI